MKAKFFTAPRAVRGSAFSEFLICLFPYMLVLLAAIFFWHIMRGRQELFNYAQTIVGVGDAPNRFAEGIIKEGEATLNAAQIYDSAAEAAYNAQVGVDPLIDEPILPYSANGKDFAAGISRAVYLLTANLDGTINVSLSKIGQRLQAQGVIKNVNVGDRLSPDTNLNFEIDETIAGDVSKLLSEWLTYRGVEGGTYRYALHFGAERTYGLESGAMPNWRSRTGITTGGGRTFGAYRTYSEQPDLRGSYTNVQLSTFATTLNIDLNALSAPSAKLNYHKYNP